MSTNCYIGRLFNDGDEGTKVEYIYCHYDGYVKNGVGESLLNYDTEEKVEELLSFGDASSIESTLDKCVFYTRDRGEKYQDNESYISSFELMLAILYKEIVYIFKDNEWHIIVWDFGNFKKTHDLVLIKDII